VGVPSRCEQGMLHKGGRASPTCSRLEAAPTVLEAAPTVLEAAPTVAAPTEKGRMGKSLWEHLPGANKIPKNSKAPLIDSRLEAAPTEKGR